MLHKYCSFCLSVFCRLQACMRAGLNALTLVLVIGLLSLEGLCASSEGESKYEVYKLCLMCALEGSNYKEMLDSYVRYSQISKEAKEAARDLFASPPLNSAFLADKIVAHFDYFCVHMQDQTVHYWMNRAREFRVLSQDARKPLVFERVLLGQQFNDYYAVQQSQDGEVQTGNDYLIPYTKNTYMVKDSVHIEREKMAPYNLHGAARTSGTRDIFYCRENSEEEFHDDYGIDYSPHDVFHNVQNIIPRSRIPIVDAHTKKFRKSTIHTQPFQIDKQNFCGAYCKLDQESLKYDSEVKHVESFYDKAIYRQSYDSNNHRFVFVGADDHVYGMKCNEDKTPHETTHSYKAIENEAPKQVKGLSCSHHRRFPQLKLNFGLCTAIDLKSDELVGWIWDYEQETLKELIVPNHLGKILKTVTSWYESCVITKDTLEVKCWTYKPFMDQEETNSSVRDIPLGRPIIDLAVNGIRSITSKPIRLCAIAQDDQSLLCIFEDGTPATAGIDLGPIKSVAIIEDTVCVITMLGRLRCFVPVEVRYSRNTSMWVDVETMPPVWRDRMRAKNPKQDKVYLDLEYCRIPILTKRWLFINSILDPLEKVDSTLVHPPVENEVDEVDEVVVQEKAPRIDINPLVEPPVAKGIGGRMLMVTSALAGGTMLVWKMFFGTRASPLLERPREIDLEKFTKEPCKGDFSDAVCGLGEHVGGSSLLEYEGVFRCDKKLLP